jgi:hypothetical protein
MPGQPPRYILLFNKDAGSFIQTFFGEKRRPAILLPGFGMVSGIYGNWVPPSTLDRKRIFLRRECDGEFDVRHGLTHSTRNPGGQSLRVAVGDTKVDGTRGNEVSGDARTRARRSDRATHEAAQFSYTPLQGVDVASLTR